jgi:hypothetical protein
MAGFSLAGKRHTQKYVNKIKKRSYFYFICFKQEAVTWFSTHPLVRKGGIGTVAVSTGAQYSLLLAWKLPQVRLGFSHTIPLYIGEHILKLCHLWTLNYFTPLALSSLPVKYLERIDDSVT